MPSVIGVILAGGQSKRMGQDKATLPFLDGRLIDWMGFLLDEALRPFGSRTIVSGCVDGFTCVSDEISGLGPLGGILSCLKWARAQSLETSFLIVPVDMPGLSPRLLETLIGSFLDSQGDTSPEVFHFREKEMPLLLRTTPRVLQVVESLCLDASPKPMRSIQELLSHLRVKSLEIPAWASPQAFSNLNTVQEWNEFGSGQV